MLIPDRVWLSLGFTSFFLMLMIAFWFNFIRHFELLVSILDTPVAFLQPQIIAKKTFAHFVKYLISSSFTDLCQP